jgi:hypothetical protein
VYSLGRSRGKEWEGNKWKRVRRRKRELITEQERTFRCHKDVRMTNHSTSNLERAFRVENVDSFTVLEAE